MKSTFIGEIFLEDFWGRQVLYILTNKLDYIEDAVYHLQTTGFLLHLFPTFNVLRGNLESIQPP